MSNPRLPLRWVADKKTDKEKKDFFESLTNNRFVLGRLKDILLEDLEALEKQGVSDYDSPSWAYKQADLNGQKRQIQRVLDLLSFI